MTAEVCRWLPLVFSSLLLLSAALPAISASGPVLDSGSSRPEHDPIDIDTDVEMALPEVVSGNGVREGSGTQIDPWVIRDWHIELSVTHKLT